MPQSRTPWIALALALCLGASRALAAVTTSLFTIAANGYAASDTNSCAIGINNLVTAGNYQFAAYYTTSQHLVIARRDLTVPGTPAWSIVDTGFTINDASDDHNVISLGVDSAGKMHVSWDMHNITLNYALSNTSVLGATFNGTSFTKLSAASAPALFPSSGTTTNEVTYPQFYNIPNSNNLLFTYRNGGAGGGSGNGNQYFDIYNPASNSWSQTFVINGEQTSVNAYLNSMDYAPNGNLFMTWTYRATPNWQTNSNILFAQSPTSGTTWQNQSGTAYALPIVQNTGGPTTSSNGQIIKTIPQGASFINQTSMTSDNFNHPLVATYFAPGWTPTSATAGSGNPNRQYELVYYTGTTWITSQISSRTHDAAVDFSGADVRDLGRPIVLVDKQNRILVVTRSTDGGLGDSENESIASTGKNNIVIYYTTDSMTAGNLPSTLTWNSIVLDAANMGIWEPTYDSIRWNQSGILDLFYEPVGLTEQTRASSPLAGTVSVLEWNEQAFFGVPEPSSLALLGVGCVMLLRRKRA